jgi:sec-independent protein translocase protein TatA
MGLSLPHLLVVFMIVILVFGSKRLKHFGGDLGAGIKGFRDTVKDNEKTFDYISDPIDQSVKRR